MQKMSLKQYSQFSDARTRASVDLARHIPLTSPKRIMDIGCGLGNSTYVLKKRYPNAHIIGVDNSREVLNKAREYYPDLTFCYLDVAKDLVSIKQKYDLLFSNTAIQWIPNHAQVLRNMINIVNDGGVVAIQTPLQAGHPMHAIIQNVCQRDPWKEKLEGIRTFYNLKEEEYFDLLSELSSDFTYWFTTYCHRMPNYESIMELLKGIGMFPYLEKLNEEESKRFESEIFEEVKKAFPVQKNGEILFHFPRLFLIAVK